MNLKYKILRINAEQQSFVVRYYTDIVSEHSLATSPIHSDDGFPFTCLTDVNLTIYEPDLSDEEIHERITACAPVNLLRLQEHMIKNEQTNTVFERLKDKLGKETPFNFQAPDRKSLTEQDIEKLIEEFKNA